jgi:hypothetical protein
MTDDALIDGFEAGALAPADFHHRDHLRLAWAYLERYGREGAERRLLAGLAALAARSRQPEKFDAALTRAWVAAIDDARLTESASTFELLVAARPDLLDRRAVQGRASRGVVSR